MSRQLPQRTRLNASVAVSISVFHSTESAILKVLSDIYSAIDSQHVVLLGLLDLSAAFDCIKVIR